MDFEKLKKFALSDWLHDLTLIFRNSKEEAFELPTHKIILASQSNFLFHLFKENPSLRSLELPVTIDSFHRETTLEDCQKILKFVYSGRRFDHLLSDLGLTFENSLNYFAIAKMLGLDDLEKRLSTFVLEVGFKRGNEIDSLKNTIKFGNVEWEEDLMKRIARKFQVLAFLHEPLKTSQLDESATSGLNENREKLLNLPLKSFSRLLERDDLNVEREDIVLKLVIDYIKMREDFAEREQPEDAPVDGPSELYDFRQIFSEKYYQEHFADEEAGSEPPKEAEQEDKGEDAPEDDSEEAEAKPKETIRFDMNWNVKSVEPLQNFKLSTEQKRELLKKVRLSFVSHSYLIQVTREQILQNFTDLILEAMSLKLSKFEMSNTDYTINCAPRNPFLPSGEIHPEKFVRGKQPRNPSAHQRTRAQGDADEHPSARGRPSTAVVAGLPLQAGGFPGRESEYISNERGGERHRTGQQGDDGAESAVAVQRVPVQSFRTEPAHDEAAEIPEIETAAEPQAKKYEPDDHSANSEQPETARGRKPILLE